MSERIPIRPLTAEEMQRALRGESVEVIPSPGPGKRIVLHEDGTYSVEDATKEGKG